MHAWQAYRYCLLTLRTTGIVTPFRLNACPCHLRGSMPSMMGSIAAVTANVPRSTKYAVSTAFTMSFGRSLKSAKRPIRTALPIKGNFSASCMTTHSSIL